MSALTLTPRALYEEVAELLRQRIFNKQLEPGSWIDELKLAEEYGISRTPLREALKVLATEGLVTMKVRRGAYVTEVNAKDQRDVYHLLSLLEALMAARGNTETFFEINERFHVRLLEIADNRWRDQLVADLRKVMKLNRHNSLLKSGRVDESLQEHQLLLDALLARDPALSAQRMREHFANGLEAAG